MRTLIRHRPSPALVVACAALAVALGGTSYAAVVLPAGSVGTKQLRNGSVIASKVKDGTLVARKFAAGQLQPGPKGDPGPQGTAGPQGVEGPAGVQGPKGDSAARDFVVVSRAGDKLRASDGVQVEQIGGAGRYEITFAHDVSKCAAIASLGADGDDDANAQAGFAAAVPNGPAERIVVQTFDDGGGRENEPFGLAVFC